MFFNYHVNDSYILVIYLIFNIMMIIDTKIYTNIESAKQHFTKKRFYRNNSVKLINIAVIFVKHIA